MKPRCRHVLIAVFLKLLLNEGIVEGKQFTSPGKQLFPLQWRILTEGLPQNWNGLWIRYFANGTVRTETNSTRNYEVPPGENEADPQSFIQTISTSNPNWLPSGETLRKFLYKNGNPMTIAQRILPNGTLGRAFPSGSLFLMGEGDVTITASIGEAFSFDKKLRHPRDPTIRFTVIGVYQNFKLSFASYPREVNGTRAYPANFWSNSRTARTRRELPVIQQPRFWRASCRCITKNFVLRTTEMLNVTEGWTLPSQPKERMSILELPDNVTFYHPTTLTDYNRRKVSFMILWIVDERTAVKAVISFNLKGDFSHACTTTYWKIMK